MLAQLFKKADKSSSHSSINDESGLGLDLENIILQRTLDSNQSSSTASTVSSNEKFCIQVKFNDRIPGDRSSNQFPSTVSVRDIERKIGVMLDLHPSKMNPLKLFREDTLILYNNAIDTNDTERASRIKEEYHFLFQHHSHFAYFFFRERQENIKRLTPLHSDKLSHCGVIKSIVTWVNSMSTTPRFPEYLTTIKDYGSSSDESLSKQLQLIDDQFEKDLNAYRMAEGNALSILERSYGVIDYLCCDKMIFSRKIKNGGRKSIFIPNPSFQSNLNNLL